MADNKRDNLRWISGKCRGSLDREWGCEDKGREQKFRKRRTLTNAKTYAIIQIEKGVIV